MAKSPDEKHAKQVVNPEHIPVIEFDYAFAIETTGGPKISMMVATDSIHGSIFAVVARRKRWPGRLCDAEFSKLHRSIGIGEGRIEM